MGAINTFEALDQSSLDRSLQKKLRILMKEYNKGSSPEIYIHRAAKQLLHSTANPVPDTKAM